MHQLQAELEKQQSVVDQPLKLSNPESYAWDDEADLVVIGFGAAGSCAAIEAHDLGNDVLLVERFSGGGAVAFSGGVVYAAGTRYQREAGIDDNPDEMYKYIIAEEANTVVSEETIREFCDTSAENLDWLVSLGLEFGSSYHPGKATYPDEGKFLYFSGSEAVPKFAAVAKPAARGHRTKGVGHTGKDFFKGLRRAVQQRDIRVSDHSRAMRLIVSDDGAVLGVEIVRIPEGVRASHQKTYDAVYPWRPFNYRRNLQAVVDARKMEAEADRKRISIKAKKGVIIATGGFGYNFNMMRQYFPRVADAFHAMLPNAAISCDGSGIQLGQSVGGATAFMHRKLITRMLTPPASKAKGLLVNQEGKRFINEDAYIGGMGEAVEGQEGSKAWLVLDNKTYWDVIKEALPSKRGWVVFKNFGLPTLINFLFGGTQKANTIAELERKCGLPAGSLTETVEELHTALDKGLGDPIGKNADYARRLGPGPYRAFNADLDNITTFTGFFTLGGLRVDEATNAVLDESGEKIPGLYAIGRAAVGVCSKDYFASGISLQDCVFSGRRAARAAVRANYLPDGQK